MGFFFKQNGDTYVHCDVCGHCRQPRKFHCDQCQICVSDDRCPHRIKRIRKK